MTVQTRARRAESRRPAQFAEVLQVFARAVRGLHDDLTELRAAGAPQAMLDQIWDAEPAR